MSERPMTRGLKRRLASLKDSTSKEPLPSLGKKRRRKSGKSGSAAEPLESQESNFAFKLGSKPKRTSAGIKYVRMPEVRHRKKVQPRTCAKNAAAAPAPLVSSSRRSSKSHSLAAAASAAAASAAAASAAAAGAAAGAAAAPATSTAMATGKSSIDSSSASLSQATPSSSQADGFGMQRPGLVVSTTADPAGPLLRPTSQPLEYRTPSPVSQQFQLQQQLQERQGKLQLGLDAENFVPISPSPGSSSSQQDTPMSVVRRPIPFSLASPLAPPPKPVIFADLPESVVQNCVLPFLTAREVLQMARVSRGVNETVTRGSQFRTAHRRLDDWRVLLYLQKNELVHLLPNYMPHHNHVNARMRAKLNEWLIQLNQEFDNHLQTIHLAVALLDAYLSRMQVSRPRLQLVGVVCFLIASKLEETNFPDLLDLVYFCDDIYTREQIVKMESVVLKKLQHRVHRPTAWEALSILLNNAKNLSPYAVKLCHYLVTQSLLEYRFVQQRCPPSLVALATLGVVCYHTEEVHTFNRLLDVTNTRRQDLRQPVQLVVDMLQTCDKWPRQYVRQQYSRTDHLRVSQFRPTEGQVQRLLAHLSQPSAFAIDYTPVVLSASAAATAMETSAAIPMMPGASAASSSSGSHALTAAALANRRQNRQGLAAVQASLSASIAQANRMKKI